jgi:hypothetical protein
MTNAATLASLAVSGALSADSSGNVGVGTTSPGAKLEVKGASATAGQLSIHDGTGDTTVSGVTAASLLFQARDSSVRTIAEIDAVNTTTNGTGGAMVFQTRISDTLAERMRIDSSGNVGIGTSSPISVAKTSIKQAAGGGTGSTQLHLEQSNATDGYGLKCDSADGALAFSRYSSGSYTERARIASNGDFTIASTTLYITNIPTTATAGNCLISAGEGNKFYRSTSSLKYKRNVVDMQRGIADVQQLRPVNFNGVSDFDGNKLFAGFIAEEVEALNFKEFVIYDENGEPDGLQYANMVALLTKAIQEQQQMIETLQAKVAALEAK